MSAALRQGAALTRADHVACVRVSGPAAFEAVDRIVPRELFIRDGQMLHTLLLEEDARPRADLYVACDEDDFLLLAEGITGPALAALVDDARAADLGATHRLLSVNGPYAWELLSEVLTPDLIGLPYLGLFHHADLVCFRGGKTGEYGYDLLVPGEHAEALERDLVAVGEAFDLGHADLAALDVCTLENGFFSARWPLPDDVTPLELQLQWRISYRKDHRAAEALRARRQVGARRRTVTVLSPSPLAGGDLVTLGDQPIGSVLQAAPSSWREAWVGLALVEAEYAYAGLDAFAAGGRPIYTVSAPVLNNRSLYVDPQRHAYRTRHEDRFPPLVERNPWVA